MTALPAAGIVVLSAVLMDQKAFGPKFIQEDGGGWWWWDLCSASEAVLLFLNKKKYPEIVSLLEVVAPSPSKSVL